MKEPVIHAIGFHDFYGAMSLPQKTDRGRKNHLRERMNFTSIVFLGQEIMEGVLRRGQTTNKKGTLDYCMLKPSMLRNIFLDRENFTFNGVKASSAEEFFGFDRRNYMFLGEVNDRTLPLDYAFALHHKREARALDYFMGMCLGATK